MLGDINPRTQKMCVWVVFVQEDTFIPTMTCNETLAFYAAVLLSGGSQQRRQQVKEVIREMGLATSSDTLVRGTHAYR